MVNKNIASSKFTDELKTKEGMPSRASPSVVAWLFLEYYLGVPWASQSLGSRHSLLRSPSKLHPKLENFTTQNLTELREMVSMIKTNHSLWYCQDKTHNCSHTIPTVAYHFYNLY